MANTTYNRDDLLIAEFKEAFNEFDKVLYNVKIDLGRNCKIGIFFNPGWQRDHINKRTSEVKRSLLPSQYLVILLLN